MRFTSFTLHDFFEPQIDPRLQIIFCKKNIANNLYHKSAYSL